MNSRDYVKMRLKFLFKIIKLFFYYVIIIFNVIFNFIFSFVLRFFVLVSFFFFTFLISSVLE